MPEPLGSVLDRFAGRPGVSILRMSESKALEIRQGQITVRITVADSVLEWFIDIVDTEIHEWFDYTGYDSTSQEELAVEMRADVCQFAEQVLNSELRLSNGKRALEWRVDTQWEQALPFVKDSTFVRFLSRGYELIVACLCLGLGGLITLTSSLMLINIYLTWESGTNNFFWIALAGAVLAPTVFVAGLRLLTNKPHKQGGLFSPLMLTVLAVFYGVVGGAVLILATVNWHIGAIVGGVAILATTQAAFTMARRRKRFTSDLE